MSVEDIELSVDVPDAWHVSTPWNSIGNERYRFTVAGHGRFDVCVSCAWDAFRGSGGI